MPDIKKPDLGWYSKLIRRLCGPIEPYGESNYDRDVYDNLQNYYAVMDCCLVQLRKFVECKSRVEASMKSCWESAYKYLKVVKEYIDDTLERIEE